MSDTQTQTEADTKSGVGSTQALHATILAANDMFYQKFEERFGTEPELLPMFILVGPDGSTVPITGDQFDMDPAVLSQIMKATGTVRYGFTAEAWQASQTAPFKPGDKVMVPLTDSGHHGLAMVEQVDVGDDLEVAVRFPGAEAITIISPLDIELANDNAATQAAAGGLAGLLAKALQDYMSGCSDNGGSVLSALRDEAEVRELFVWVLATDEAQRLLRLHG